MLQPFNVLVMDEPTNHLDIKSKNVLKQALKNFEGTLIIVSHDRDFLQGLTKTVYEFKNRKIKEYLGDIDFYLDQRQAENMRAIEKKDEVARAAKRSQPDEGKQSYKDQKKVKSLQNKLSNTEAKIAKLEKEIKEKDVELATNYEEMMAKPDFLEKYNKNKQKLEELMLEWEELQEKLDQYA